MNNEQKITVTSSPLSPFGGQGGSSIGRKRWRWPQEVSVTNSAITTMTWGGVYGGYGDGTSVNNKGTNMNFWTTTGAGTNAYNLNINFTSGNINPQNYNNQRYGFQVRCVR